MYVRLAAFLPDEDVVEDRLDEEGRSNR